MNMTAEEKLVKLEKLAMYYLEEPKYKYVDNPFIKGYSLGHFRGEWTVAKSIMKIINEQ